MKQFDILLFKLLLDIELKGQSTLKLLANIEEEYLSFIFSKL
jgi:hypothetical protein